MAGVVNFLGQFSKNSQKFYNSISNISTWYKKRTKKDDFKTIVFFPFVKKIFFLRVKIRHGVRKAIVKKFFFENVQIFVELFEHH